MTQVEVKSTDVIKLVLQFLKENSTSFSLRSSRIILNLAEGVQDHSQHYRHQRVRKRNNGGTLGPRVAANQPADAKRIVLHSSIRHLFNAYELIVDDLLEHDRYQAAEFVIKSCIKKHIRNLTGFRERVLRLEYIVDNPQEKALHKRLVTEHRKREVIKQCLSEVHIDV
jgi:hypothetical protein